MSTALYRRYRPETFAEVIGQDHVTAPLMQALRSGRVNHAYLFSGPRGCGKTTSARILARTLNCEQNTLEHPVDTPCGRCPSCVDLARGGPGSLDVVEIDAASHGGVDDARDLRERATFAPTRDRYKIFIIDEAHMVSPAGFNALLKIVEEPPEHVKFVFATTEPDKVIGTIRSRTHHYPFRLVPPDVLGPYLEQLCAAEGVTVGSGVFPLVTRAGGGSVRDSLSVMDQLIAGAEDSHVDYERAVALLGYTHATLLDDVVDALAARDGASIFRVVDQVIATGHEPRRFVEDVLERLRDLIVIAVSGDEAAAVLRDQPADQLARMRAQAQNLGVAELSRAADLANDALTEMSGATSPRLHLELLVARLLLPGADDGAAGFAARLDRLERGGLAAPAGAAVPAAPGPVATVRPDVAAAPAPARPAPGAAGGLTGAAAVRAALRPAAGDPVVPETGAAPDPVPVRATDPVPVTDPVPATDPVSASDPEPASSGRAADAEPVGTGHETVGPIEDEAVTPPTSAVDAGEPDGTASSSSSDEPTAGTMTTEMLRRRWDEVVAALGNQVTRALVGPNAQVVSLDDGVLRIGFVAPGIARTFSQPRHVEAVEESLYQTLGVRARVEASVQEGGAGPAVSGPERAQDPPSPDGPPYSDEPVQDVPRTPGDTSAAGTARSGLRPSPGTGGVNPPSQGENVAPRGTAPAGTGSGRVAPGGLGGARAVGAAAPGPSRSAPQATAVAVERDRSSPGVGVAVAERPDPGASTTPGEASVDAAEAADAAWLAGGGLTAPVPAPAPAGTAFPADPAPAPEPSVRRTSPAPGAPGAVSPAPAALAPAAAAPRSTSRASTDTGVAAPVDNAPVDDAPARRVPESPRRLAERQVREARSRTAPAVAPPTSVGVAEFDEPSADDPDIVSSGLVGAALVARLLDGKVIEEIQDQGS
ncbi:DNA polymerase III subunit gamma and tau [Cellulosimicrobium arenosum]|uniref:DNA-directed DNA polymerase n=1 Tax=Cellulosimicrobium arenosum TaxID=2708133 RepID=A0A927J0Q3_9MICO|nr:DNA polymerase III subunit gamma and tau [Cellulosimicrobium arenosum]